MWQPSLSPHRCSAPSRSESCPSGQPNGYPCLSLGSPLRLSASPLAASPAHDWPPLRLTTGRLSGSPLARRDELGDPRELRPDVVGHVRLRQALARRGPRRVRLCLRPLPAPAVLDQPGRADELVLAA